MSSTPPTLFLSYSLDDEAFANQLKSDLQAQGYGIWIDKVGLRPGTPDWEEALRQAIRLARAVLLVASPSSRNSRFVRDELRIAGMYRLAVVPVWARGEEWMDSIPMGWGGIQYCDARDARYPTAVQEVLGTLRDMEVVPLAAPAPAAGGAPIGASAGPPAPAPPGAAAPPSSPLGNAEPRNPYKGLRPFSGADAGDFFGRDGLIGEMVGSLRAALAAPGTPAGTRLLTVVGASGSGKSSVVMAGLLPRLRAGAIEGSDRWIYLDPMVPSTHPLETLAVSLSGALPERSLRAIREDLEGDDARGLHLLAASAARQGGARVVLLVDQFEELFTLTESEAERQRFIELLTTAVGEPRGGVIALLTLRADFYDRPMQYAELYQMMRQHEQPVLPMDTEELRAVIERPAALPDVQLRFEEPLVGDLLYEVQGQAGGLPLLQFTLDQLYERREGRRLTIAAYRAIGGVRGALAKHAEATYAGLPTDQHRDMARILFLRLIDPGPTDQGATRRRASLREITLPDPALARVIWDVANAFIVARLLVASDAGGETALEVSHEALIQQWARLADWLREGREDLRLQLQIGADAHDWAQHGRPADRLYRGTVLAEAEGWMERATPSVAEAEFIRASVTESQRQTHEELARAAHELELQKRVTRRQRYGLAASGLAVALAIALVVAQLFSAMNLSAANRTLTREKAALQQANSALKASIPVDVTSMGDSGPGTLRDAIAAAPDGAAITFARNLRGTITLTSELEIDRDLTISGPGASQLTISGGDKTRVFYLGGTTSIHITITNLTIAHGHATTDDSHTTPGAGGAIYNDGDSLLLLNVTAHDNTADSVGGAFYNTDNLNIVRGDVEGNSAAQDGGGIYNDGSYGAALSLQQTTISGNKAGGNGGGVAQSAPTASLAADNVLYTDAADGSTIAQNTAQGLGNNVYAAAGSVTASGSGSSIDVSSPGDVVCTTKAQCPQGATITK